MELVDVRMKEDLSVEFRNALKPLIYTVFDGMKANQYRGINSMLTEAGRATFKTMYDDYKQNGQWTDR